MNKRLGNLFKGDKVIWMVFFFLCLISIVEVFSASSGLTYRSGNYLGPIIKHMAILAVGIMMMVVVVNIRCKYFKIATPFMLLLSAATLIWVVFAGARTNDASRWIELFGIQFQPSELAKGTLILATAQILSAMQTDNGADRNAMKYILMMCSGFVLLIAVENLSTAVLICAVIFMMMVIGRVPGKQLGQLIGVVMFAVVFVVGMVMIVGEDVNEQPQTTTTEIVAKDGTTTEEVKTVGHKGVLHRLDTWKSRINKFLNGKEVAPEDVNLDDDAQVAHANIAIASSGFIGKGPGNSDERDFLSQAFSDFIYAIIIEEMGILGAFFVAMLYITLLFRTGRIATRCENNFPAFLAMGLALLLATQALFNMCVAVGLVPVTGQPLPLISKGGTSSIVNCIFIGAILSVSRSAKKNNVSDRSAAPKAVVAD